MRNIDRRKFVTEASLVSMSFLMLSRCTKGIESKEVEIKPLKIVSDPKQYLDLPKGFTYRIISQKGDNMSDGFLVPGRPDGMGTFQGKDGRTIIIRNHENSPAPADNSPFGLENKLLSKVDLQNLYDPGNAEVPGLGGTTTIVYNEKSGKVEKEFLSLAGTYRNCAGGITPWQSWLTCEEDTTIKEGPIEKDHGYVFEVPATERPGLAAPTPLKAMGRFNHEAVAVDPKTGIVYQTEDRHDGLIYRFIPNKNGDLLQGGRLQALAIRDKKSFDTRNWGEANFVLNQEMEVYWIDVEDVESPEDNLRQQGFDQGAARFARGEGMWMGNNEVYFACTNGGPNKYGQVFKYKLSPVEGQKGEIKQPGKLELFLESKEKSVLHMCDNLTLAPWGSLFLCEDNGETNRIHIVNPKGQIHVFGINKSSGSEFAGAVFSPSGNTLFVNMQEDGDTIAITGPWQNMVS